MSVRTISLVPSVTETVSAWGIVPVACTRFCERDDLEAVGGTKDPDIERIVELAPDVVVVDTEENRRDDAQALRAAGLDVHVLAVRSVADVDDQLAGLAHRLGVPSPPRHAATSAPPPTWRGVVPIWRRPWMLLGPGTYGADLLAHAGVEVMSPGGGPYEPAELDTWGDVAPDVVIAPDEPYPFGPRHHDELATVAPVVFVDGADLFWWGARTSSAMSRLAAVVAAGPTAAPHPSQGDESSGRSGLDGLDRSTAG